MDMKVIKIVIVLAIVGMMLLGMFAYRWIKNRVVDTPEDSRIPGVEDAIRQQREGLKNPPKVDFDNIPRDGKG